MSDVSDAAEFASSAPAADESSVSAGDLAAAAGRELPDGDSKEAWLGWFGAIGAENADAWRSVVAFLRDARVANAPPPPPDWNALVESVSANNPGVDRSACIRVVRAVLERLHDPALVVEARYPKKSKKKRPRAEDGDGGDEWVPESAPAAASVFTHKIHTAPVVERCDFRRSIESYRLATSASSPRNSAPSWRRRQSASSTPHTGPTVWPPSPSVRGHGTMIPPQHKS